MKPEIIINGREIPMNIVSKKRKTISLTVEGTGELLVKAPVSLTKREILKFVESKKKWIDKRLQKFDETVEAGTGSGLTGGRILYYLGKPRLLKISGEKMIVFPDTLIVSSDFTEQKMEDWYRQESHRLVTEFVEKNKSAIPRCTFRIRSQKRIWGSCSSKRNININSRISMCRPSAFEYIMWHEICHLKHMNHSKDFYNCLKKVFPKYKEEKKWLREHEHLLIV